MAQKILVSKPTKDVLTATSPNDFYMDSAYPLLKVHSSGTFSFATAWGEVEIEHNLGYKPFVLVFSQFSDFDFDDYVETKTDEYYQHDWYVFGASWQWWGSTKIYDDKVLIQVGNSGASSALQIQGFYYIFKDEVL